MNNATYYCMPILVRCIMCGHRCDELSLPLKEGGTCLFDINNHNTEYTSVKILSGDSH